MPHNTVLWKRLPKNAFQNSQESVRSACAGVREKQRAEDGEPGCAKVKRQEYRLQEVGGKFPNFDRVGVLHEADWLGGQFDT